MITKAKRDIYSIKTISYSKFEVNTTEICPVKYILAMGNNSCKYRLQQNSNLVCVTSRQMRIKIQVNISILLLDLCYVKTNSYKNSSQYFNRRKK